MTFKKLNFHHIFTRDWAFIRCVSEPNITITGMAHFEASDNNRVLYTEKGLYQLHNDCQTCFQSHTYHVTPTTFTLLKSDGVLLHQVNVTDTMFPVRAQHDHLCNQDVYHCKWVFHDHDHFDMLYTVKGPKKDYQIKTVFSRIFQNG